MLGGLALAALALAALKRHRSDADILTGKTIGVYKVGEAVGRRRHHPTEAVPQGQSHILYDVMCQRCGAHQNLTRTDILRAPSFCKKCPPEVQSDARSVRLTDGRTLAQVARDTGIPLNTIERRWKRGWPESALTTPVQRGGHYAEPKQTEVLRRMRKGKQRRR